MNNHSETISKSLSVNKDKKMAKMTGKNCWQIRLGLLSALTMLAACQLTNQMTPLEPVAYTARHPIQVVNDVVSMEVRGGRRKLGLTNEQRDRIASFIAGYKNTGTGSLKIKAPSAVAHDVLAANTVAEVRRIAERSSVSRSKIRMANYYPRNPRVSSPVILSYRRHGAIGAPCGAWPEPSTRTYENKPAWSLGCATQNNLAAMIANPRDLVEQRRVTPSDAQRRDVVIEKYRAGSVTTAERSEAETGTVSSVAK